MSSPTGCLRFFVKSCMDINCPSASVRSWRPPEFGGSIAVAGASISVSSNTRRLGSNPRSTLFKCPTCSKTSQNHPKTVFSKRLTTIQNSSKRNFVLTTSTPWRRHHGDRSRDRRSSGHCSCGRGRGRRHGRGRGRYPATYFIVCRLVLLMQNRALKNVPLQSRAQR